MEKFVVTGGKPLRGTITVSGAKNVALKTLVAACLTEEEVVIHNIPHISDFFEMTGIMKELGAEISLKDHTITVRMVKFKSSEISLDKTAKSRTSAMFIAPLLSRTGKAIIPNPSGCRLGARPIDRTIEGIKEMGVAVEYRSEDGYFHAKTLGDNLGIRPIDRTIDGLKQMGAAIDYDKKERAFSANSVNGDTHRLQGINYTFKKNTHTGTETLILAAVLAKGKSILKNAAEEPEIDELIDLLNAMGAQVKRTAHREITIEGVEKLYGATCTIKPDRNEIITFAIAAIVTGGDVFIKDATKVDIDAFIDMIKKAGGGIEIKKDGVRFYAMGNLKATNVTTSIYPGFMTDWQAPWAVLMTKAKGVSIIHETVFENKLGYIDELKRMGAKVKLFNPIVKDPEKTYNFNLADNNDSYFHGVKIYGSVQLHDAVLTMFDIRAGAAVVLAALAAEGTSTIFGVDKLDRGYEKLEERLKKLGATIKRVKED